MRLRPKRLQPSIGVKQAPTSPRPITLRMGPALEFDLTLDEARTLATELVDAICAAQQAGAL